MFRIKNFFTNNIGLKLLALLLAVVTWAYIVAELQEGEVAERAALQSILPPYRLVSKKVPIKLSMIGEPKTGYVVAYDKIVIRPNEFLIVGPKSIIDPLTSIDTEPVDITGYSKTFMKDISVVPPTKGVIREKFVTITVPSLGKKD